MLILKGLSGFLEIFIVDKLGHEMGHVCPGGRAAGKDSGYGGPDNIVWRYFRVNKRIRTNTTPANVLIVLADIPLQMFSRGFIVARVNHGHETLPAPIWRAAIEVVGRNYRALRGRRSCFLSAGVPADQQDQN